MAPTKGSQQFFVVLLPKYVVVSPPQFLVVRLLQFLACCGAGLLAVNNRRLRTIFGQSVDSRHWSRLIYGITSDSSRFLRLLFFSKISFFCSPHLSTLIKEHIKASNRLYIIYGLLKKFLYQSNKRIFLHECCTLQQQDGYNHTCVKGEEKNCDKFIRGETNDEHVS